MCIVTGWRSTSARAVTISQTYSPLTVPTFDCSSSRHNVRNATLVTPAIGASTTGLASVIGPMRKAGLPPAHRQLACRLMQLERGGPLTRACLPLELALLGHLESIAGQLEFLDQQGKIVAQFGCLTGEVFALEDAPFLQHRHDDLVEVDARVVDAPDGDGHGFSPELGYLEA